MRQQNKGLLSFSWLKHFYNRTPKPLKQSYTANGENSKEIDFIHAQIVYCSNLDRALPSCGVPWYRGMQPT